MTTPKDKQMLLDRTRFVQKINSEYIIGECLMPSTHRGQQVRFAKRILDGRRYAVKIRDKLVSFKDAIDVSTWRESMGYLLVLQDDEAFGKHVARIHELLEDQRNYYVIMELVDGIDLFEFLHSCRSLDLDMMALFFRKVAYEVLLALKDYKRNKLVHKDLKLENIVLSDVTTPYVFVHHNINNQQKNQDKNQEGKNNGGSTTNANKSSSTSASSSTGESGSRKSGSSGTSTSGTTTSTTTNGKENEKNKKSEGGILKIIDFDTVEAYDEGTIAYDVMGTDQYIAPEAYYGIYSTASDMFALGSLLYKTVTGVFPFLETLFDDESGENYVGHPKMRQIRGKLKLAKVDYVTHPFFHYDKYATNFIRSCLIFDQSKRLTVEAALAHPAMADYEQVKSIKWMDLWKGKERSSQ